MSRRQEVRFAVVFGIATHIVFVISVAMMFVALHSGLRTGLGQLHGWKAWAVDALLIAQFPILHSCFLSPGGKAILARIAPGDLGADLTTTTFALVASLQLLVAFGLWSSSGIVFYEATGVMYGVYLTLYIASWVFLIKALKDAGLGLQTGFMGWSSVVMGKRPGYASFPTQGLFRVCRHPVYLGFALILWTAPVMTPDGLLLAAIWSLYCLIGPRFKEARYRERYGERYVRYAAALPYILPGTRRLPRDWAREDS